MIQKTKLCVLYSHLFPILACSWNTNRVFRSWSFWFVWFYFTVNVIAFPSGSVVSSVVTGFWCCQWAECIPVNMQLTWICLFNSCIFLTIICLFRFASIVVLFHIFLPVKWATFTYVRFSYRTFFLSLSLTLSYVTSQLSMNTIP